MKYCLIGLLIFFYACNSTIKYPEQGYSFSKEINPHDSNFFFYPIKDSLTLADSFRLALLGRYYFSAFKESNLSLRPSDKAEFRLLYFGPMVSTYIVTLTQNKIIVKKAIKGWIEPYHDTSKLNAKERLHYSFLERYFPFEENRQQDTNLRFYLDSVVKRNPELKAPSYYQYLLNRSADYGEERFGYSTKIIPISQQTFRQLVEAINSSGYWSLPHRIICQNPPNDGFDFILEANTPKKYKIVFSGSCPDNVVPFTKACQVLINEAGLKNEIKLVINE